MKADTRISRLALSNWPVRWKIVAVVVVPLALAGVFGGARIYSSVTAAVELRGAAARTDMVPAVVDYLAALEDTMVAATERIDAQPALTAFDSRRVDLQRELADTEVPDSVGLAINTMFDDGQDLLGRVMGNAGDLRTRVMDYVQVLSIAETAITGLVSDGRDVRSEGEALAGAVGLRGQLVMQQLLVSGDGDLPEPVVRSVMLALAGAESSMVSSMDAYLGAATGREAVLRSEMDNRLLVISDPESVLIGNPELLSSQRITRDIVEGVIAETTDSIPATVERQANDARSAAIRDAALVVVAMVIALLLVRLVARSLVRPLRTLRHSALKVVNSDLAREVEHVRSDGKPLPVQPIPVHTSEEIGQVARAVDELHKRAVQLAAEQARLQLRVADVFDTLSRRNRSMVDQQLSLIDRLECNEEDPDRLENLSRLHHLAARLRRNSADLLVLAGPRIPREQVASVPVGALIDAAIDAATAKVQDSTRVVTAGLPDSEVFDTAASDLVHLLGELLDNALLHSPPTTQVNVSAVHTVNGGLVLEVADTGLGMTESDLRVANARLQSGGEVNSYTARHIGLVVVARLAAQHGLVVRLRSTVAGEPGSGITAGVYVPAGQLVAGGPRSQTSGPDSYHRDVLRLTV